MKRFLYAVLGVVLWPGVILGGCGSAEGSKGLNEPLQSINTAMGTIISQTIYLQPESSDSPAGQDQDSQEDVSNTKITSDILTSITDLEENLLSWRLDTSEVYAVNTAAESNSQIILSEELTVILEKCLQVSEASEGAFDITIGEVVRLWDIDSWAAAEDLTGYVLPGKDAIERELANTGYEKLLLQDNHLSISDRVQIDLGAVGKGIALDVLREQLDTRSDVKGAVISVGGSILTYGEKPDGSSWRVAVVNPNKPSANLGYLELRGSWCVSTSGDYERYVEIDGVRYHHIIDPSTGYPADSGLAGVTILSEDGLLSDALSTACFILGAEKGSELVEQFGAEALFVDRDGNITMTEGMERIFRK